MPFSVHAHHAFIGPRAPCALSVHVHHVFYRSTCTLCFVSPCAQCASTVHVHHALISPCAPRALRDHVHKAFAPSVLAVHLCPQSRYIICLVMPPSTVKFWPLTKPLLAGSGSEQANKRRATLCKSLSPTNQSCVRVCVCVCVCVCLRMHSHTTTSLRFSTLSSTHSVSILAGSYTYISFCTRT
jgi:hypothetical protein